MFAPGWRSAALAVLAAVLLAAAALAESPAHQKKPARLLSTVHAKYRMMQQDREIGVEGFERRTYDNNAVVYEMAGAAAMAGALFSQKSSLVVDEESYFPRSFRTDKTVIQQGDTTLITFTVDMFSNVAVVGSEMQGRADSRRVVVPAGIPIVEVGVAYGWYQIIFWLDMDSRERQRISWLDPQRGVIESGEMFFTGEETVDVLGKKTQVLVFKAEREKLGTAILHVDSARRIVRCEQNMTIYELVEWSEK